MIKKYNFQNLISTDILLPEILEKYQRIDIWRTNLNNTTKVEV